MEKFLPALQKCALFAGMTAEEICDMLMCMGAKVQLFSRGSIILQEGDAADRVGVVLSGSAQVERADYQGNRSIMTRLLPGQLFAEAFACAGVGQLPVSVRALEDTHAVLIAAERIIHTCGKNCGFHTQLVYNLMRVLAVKNLLCQQKIEVTSQRTTREKLLSYLAICAKNAGSRRFSIPFDRQALADYLAVDRSGLSSEIGKLRREGILKCEKNQFELLQ